MKVFFRIVFTFTVFISFKCNQEIHEKNGSPPLFELHAPESTRIHFSNAIFETTALNIITFEYLYNGAGVAAGDINQDGLTDLYFSGNMVEGKLYLNKGGFQFEDITEKAGINTKNKWGTGVSMVDVNADGLLDLYLCFAGPYAPDRRRNMLYINQGDLTFSEQAASFGLDDDAHTTHAAFLDYDKDGDLDVYLLNNITDETGPNIIRPKRNRGKMPNTDRLYRNDDGAFTNVSVEAGILKEGYGLGVAVGDINQDGWPDIYVSNDYLSNDLLYINNQDGTFTDRAADHFRHTSYSSMGCDLADYNNDARPDIVALDMLPPDHKRRKLMMGSINYNRFRSEMLSGYFPQYMRNTLQLNAGENPDGRIVFSEIGQLAGIHSTDWSWSPLLADLDNDGWKDLTVTNGYPRDITNLDFASYKANLMMKSQYDEQVLAALIKAADQVDGAYLPNFVYRNRGDLTFEDHSAAWGFTQPSFSHGAAVADLDNDGDLDYIANNSFDKVFIYENKARQYNKRHFIRLALSGPPRNPGGIGAKIWLYQDTSVQFHEHYPFRGFQSTVEPIVHFGLGDRPAIDSIAIQWPDGARQIVRSPGSDRQLSVPYQPEPSGRASTPQEKYSPLFKRADKTNSIGFQHRELHFSDFKVLPLLPHKHSQEGPRISAGDVNGDGLGDLFVGGAFRQSGQIFIQQKNGSFLGHMLNEGEAVEEDLGSVFFDADQDGDLDLYVTSGSSEFPPDSEYYQDRLYLNNGQGHFSLNAEALPSMRTSTSCVAAADYDRDGDLDLFVGGQVSPAAYPEAPRSYLLENRGGRFEDVTTQKAPELARIGMVRDAAWADLNGDDWLDLILAGEWMPVSTFLNTEGQLSNTTQAAGLEKTVGWWNRMVVSDLDQDGDPDLIGGNLGWNTPYRTSSEQPVSLFIDDIDQDGRKDPVLTYYLAGKQAPAHFRDDLLNWVLPLKKKFIDYQSYAVAELSDIISEQTARRLDAHLLATSWLENTGDGRFIVHPLPLEAQTAPVYGILADDLDRDGRTDLLLTGNTSAPNPHTGQYDAFNGLLLLGREHGRFEPQSIRESGFYVPGEGRDLTRIRGANGRMLILAAQNNGPLLGFELNRPGSVQ